MYVTTGENQILEIRQWYPRLLLVTLLQNKFRNFHLSVLS